MFLSCIRPASFWYGLSRPVLTAPRMPLKAKITLPNAKMSTIRPPPSSEDVVDDVVFSSLYGVRSIELNRPKALNALNSSMVKKITPRLLEWEKSELANIIVISGAGKAFSAGGDVRALHETFDSETAREFFTSEYQLNHLIATYSKPYIAVMDGYTMGGGVGLSVHAPFRIATENTGWCMPETSIGFFPDVGASFFLSRLDGELGTYFGLTSALLDGVQAYHAGLATHYLHSSVLSKLVTRLSELVFSDNMLLPERLALVNRTMAEFHTGIPDSPEAEDVIKGSIRKSIDTCFSASTIEEIIHNLKNEQNNKAWAEKTLNDLLQRSPTSLKVTLRQLRLGPSLSIADSLQREQIMASQFYDKQGDFQLGVRSKLIDKSKVKPDWQPATVAEVTNEMVDEYFDNQAAQLRMELLHPGQDYHEYPHARFSKHTRDDAENAPVVGTSNSKY